MCQLYLTKIEKMTSRLQDGARCYIIKLFQHEAVCFMQNSHFPIFK